MVNIYFKQTIDPIDVRPYQVVLSISFENEMLKDRIFNKYVESKTKGDSGFFFNFKFLMYIGSSPWDEESFIDLYESIEEQAIIKFHSQKKADRFQKKASKYLYKFFKKEEKEFTKLVKQAELL